MGILNNKNRKMVLESSLNIFHRKNLIFFVSGKNKKQLLEFFDLKYAEDFKIKTFNNDYFESSDLKNYLIIF